MQLLLSVQGDNIFEQLFDFFYFSFGIMALNRMSDIAALSIHAKMVVMLQMATTFLYLTIIVANYQIIGKEYKKYLGLKKGETTNELGKQ